jgi:hypothetical protein
MIRDRNAVDKLAKICGMLGSAHEGERAAAAAKATELLTSMKLTWSSVISKAFGEGNALAPVVQNGGANLWHMEYCCRLLREKRQHLSKWEIEFVISLSRRVAPVTAKQAYRLRQIGAKHFA